jgi:hypothetical protein
MNLHAYTAAELRSMADRMADDEVVLADVWDREGTCQYADVEMAPDVWRRFCAWYCENSDGLSLDMVTAPGEFLEQQPEHMRGRLTTQENKPG